MSWAEAVYTIDEIGSKLDGSNLTGIPPENMKTMKIKTGKNGFPEITVTVPKDTYLEGQLICTVKGLRIIRKHGSKPVDPYDGLLIRDLPFNTSVTFVDKDTTLVTGDTYYYGFYTYSDHGVFNLDPKNIIEYVMGEYSTYKYFAFDQDFTNLDPDASITYPEGFENSDYEPMMTNSAQGTPTFGGWQDFLDNVLHNKPYMVNYETCEAFSELDPMDYSKNIDGAPSFYNQNDKGLGCFAWMSTLWMKEEYTEDGNSRRVIFTNDPSEQENGFVPLGFWDKDKNVLKGIWIPMAVMNTSGKIIFDNTADVSGNPISYGAAINNLNTKGRAVAFGGYTRIFLRDLLWMLFKSTNLGIKTGAAGYFNPETPSKAKFSNDRVLPGWFGYNKSDYLSNTAGQSLERLMFHSQILASGVVQLLDPYIVHSNNTDLCIDTYRKRNIGIRVNDVYATFNANPDMFKFTSSGINATGSSYIKKLIPDFNPEVGDAGSMMLIEKTNNLATSNTGCCTFCHWGSNAGGASISLIYDAIKYTSFDSWNAIQCISDSNAHWDGITGMTAMLLPDPEYDPEESGE